MILYAKVCDEDLHREMGIKNCRKAVDLPFIVNDVLHGAKCFGDERLLKCNVSIRRNNRLSKWRSSGHSFIRVVLAV